MPIFKELITDYRENRPLLGTKLVIAHVIVPNTLPLIYSAVVGGAAITVTDTVPSVVDPETLELLKKAGIKFDQNLHDATGFDYAVDCTGYFRDSLPRNGLSEVTRSGIHKFRSLENLTIPIMDADNTDTKKIETFIGNPIAVKKAFDKYIDSAEKRLNGKTVGIIGFGKIGRGLARVFKKFSEVKVIDVSEDVLNLARILGYDSMKLADRRANTSFVEDADLIMTATGHPNVISDNFEKETLRNKILINVGAVDEFGEDYSEEDVFMSKNIPFNFNLIPPTGNNYIDPILALHIDSIRYLHQNDLGPGIHPVPMELDQKYVETFEQYNFKVKNLFKKYFRE